MIKLSYRVILATRLGSNKAKTQLRTWLSLFAYNYEVTVIQ